MTRIALLLSGLIAAAATATLAELPTGWRLDADSAELIHVDSGLRFPAEWKGMRRREPANFDDAGLNVGIGYDGLSPHVALTLYVYPREFGGVPDPEQHFRQSVQAAMQANPGARVEGASRRDFPLGDATVPGFHAFLVLPMPDDAVAGSFLVLVPHEHRFFKLRVTFPLTGGGEPIQHAIATLQDFLRSLRMPPSTPANAVVWNRQDSAWRGSQP